MKFSFVLSLAVAGVALPGLLATTSAHAGVTIDNIVRYVDINDLPTDANEGLNSVGAFDESISVNDGITPPATQGAASQTSLIETLTFSATGSSSIKTSTSSAGPNPYATSYFFVRFTIDATYLWNTSGLLDDSSSGEGYASAAASLYSFDASDYIFSKTSMYFSDITDSGQIGPGSYYILFGTNTDSNPEVESEASASFTNAVLTLTPLDDESNIPEPASLSLLALGGAGLLLRRRR